MRRSRLGGSARVLSSRLVFVLIALAFVGSGYLIGRYFLSSLFQKTPGTGEPVTTDPNGGSQTTATAQIATDPLTLYRVQIGAFSSLENAEKAADAASQKGVGAAVMSPDPLYKVYCGVAGSKATAEKIAALAQPKLAGSVIGKDDQLYVGTLNVPALQFSLTGDKTHVEAIKGGFETVDKSVRNLLSYWDSLAQGQTSSVSLASMSTELTATKTTLAGFTPDATLKPAYDAAVALLNSMESAISAAEDSVGGDSGKTVSAMKVFITTVDSFIEQTKNVAG